jgi:hypothetical protein
MTYEIGDYVRLLNNEIGRIIARTKINPEYVIQLFDIDQKMYRNITDSDIRYKVRREIRTNPLQSNGLLICHNCGRSGSDHSYKLNNCREENGQYSSHKEFEAIVYIPLDFTRKIR